MTLWLHLIVYILNILKFYVRYLIIYYAHIKNLSKPSYYIFKNYYKWKLLLLLFIYIKHI
jgi:hypothetical protein